MTSYQADLEFSPGKPRVLGSHLDAYRLDCIDVDRPLSRAGSNRWDAMGCDGTEPRSDATGCNEARLGGVVGYLVPRDPVVPNLRRHDRTLHSHPSPTVPEKVRLDP